MNNWKDTFREKFSLISFGGHTCEGWNDIGEENEGKAYLSDESIKALESFIQSTIDEEVKKEREELKDNFEQGVKELLENTESRAITHLRVKLFGTFQKKTP